jgi:hypothetical protein
MDTSDTSCSTTKTEAHVICRCVVPSRHMDVSQYAMGTHGGLAGTRMRLAAWSIEDRLHEHIFEDQYCLHNSSTFVLPGTQGRNTHCIVWLGAKASSRKVPEAAACNRPLRICSYNMAVRPSCARLRMARPSYRSLLCDYHIQRGVQ